MQDLPKRVPSASVRMTRKPLTNLSLACGILAALISPAAFAQQKADTVVTNGKILTVDKDFRVVAALAINDGRIVARGTNAEVARYRGPGTKVIDVKGATVIPGLIDNHFHFTRAVERWHQQARFEGVNSRREALRILAAKAASLKPGDWMWCRAAGRRGSSPIYPAASRSRSLTALHEESAVRPGKLWPRVRQQSGAQSCWAKPV